MRKLVLKNGCSPGDIVMLTAAVRDLHYWYPDQFQTDVRTSCAELWEHNPHLTPLAEGAADVETLECSYPLIDQANTAPYHCLHGFMQFLNDQLCLQIKPTVFKGDIHLSALERSWYSQVHEVTGEDTPFWIIDAGGKYDVTIKWWAHERYQAVVDHFRGRIQFVQVGAWGHYHPPLRGVIDLRGRTTLRELVRLVYHAEGVLCPVTALMHLAAAVQTRPERPPIRACVVVAGGREPAHWEAYPGHQFIHTNGLLPCCARGGCWKDRTEPLGDGDERDRPVNRCVDVVDHLPRCLHLITAEDVIRRVELHLQGNTARRLTLRQFRAAQKGVAATARNRFDQQPLSLHSARIAGDQCIAKIPACPAGFRGRGIVICAGGVRFFTNAWVCLNLLRRLGCRLPVEVWHLGAREMDEPMRALLARLGATCVDAASLRRRHPARILGGWELKPYALLHSRFEQVLLLDADNGPVRDPTFLFDGAEFRRTGAVFWPDYGRAAEAAPIWHSCGLRRPAEREFETGQILVDKPKCWPALCLAMWFNENSDFYYRHLHGDKETFHLAFRKLKQPYALVPVPIHTLPGTMCQHDFDGRRLFQHRNTDKWNLFLRNRRVPDFWFEDECRQFVRELRRRWDGRLSRWTPTTRVRRSRRVRRPTIVACMISCSRRQRLRETTLRHLAATDWGDRPVIVQLDAGDDGLDPEERQTRAALAALRRSLDQAGDYVLFLEDDLEFNAHLYHNLQCWPPLVEERITFAGLYNPGLREAACDVPGHAIIVEPRAVYGSQACLLSRRAAAFIVRHWHRAQGKQDLRMSRLAGRLKEPLYYHYPSLVQHVGRESLWGGHFHQSPDFDPDWRGPAGSRCG